MKIVSVWNNKGGVGKTTLSYHLGQGLALAGKTVMLVDNDPQLSLSTQCCGIKASELGMAQVYSGECSLKECSLIQDEIQIDEEPTLIVVPGNRAFRSVLEKDKKSVDFTNLKKGLEDPEIQASIDYVIIDNNPQFDELSKASIIAASDIVVPCIPSKMDHEGLLRTLGMVNELGCTHKLNKIVNTLVRRTKVAERYMVIQKSMFQDKVAENFVMDTAVVPECVDDKKVVYLYKYTSKYSMAMLSLIAEVFPEVKASSISSSIESVKREQRIKNLFAAINKRKEQAKMLESIQEKQAVGA